MKFSVVIPCYKSKDSIARCLGSIKDQDFKDYEIICVFDGENKSAQMIAQSLGAQVVVIPHSGVQNARNHGMKLAGGEFIIFCDCDMFWDAGSFRALSDKLDETGADFAYSGYRWDDGYPAHIPFEFDPYVFNVMNYVDGANPIRASLVRKIGGWDPEIDRFQDWDLWYRVVQAGGVGVKLMEDTIKATFRPTPDSVSGKHDYQEWYDKVSKKHNLKRSDIIVTSIAAPQHALRVAKMCGWDYWPNPGMIPYEYKAVYLLGMFPESIKEHVNLMRSKKKGKMLVHWIGTDVLHMQTMIPYINTKSLRLSFEKHGVVSFVQSESNKLEMEELGFKVKRLPLPVDPKQKTVPFPEKFTVACYDHGGMDEKWHKWLVMELCKAMPDVTFLFYGNKSAVGAIENREFAGHQPIEEIIRRSTCLLRMTPHDGFPVAAVEFMYSGRKVITNVDELKYALQVKIGIIGDDTIPDIKKRAYTAIRSVQKEPEIKNMREMMRYYESVLDPKNFKKKIEEVVNA